MQLLKATKRKFKKLPQSQSATPWSLLEFEELHWWFTYLKGSRVPSRNGAGTEKVERKSWEKQERQRRTVPYIYEGKNPLPRLLRDSTTSLDRFPYHSNPGNRPELRRFGCAKCALPKSSLNNRLSWQNQPKKGPHGSSEERLNMGCWFLSYSVAYTPNIFIRVA